MPIRSNARTQALLLALLTSLGTACGDGLGDDGELVSSDSPGHGLDGPTSSDPEQPGQAGSPPTESPTTDPLADLLATDRSAMAGILPLPPIQKVAGAHFLRDANGKPVHLNLAHARTMRKTAASYAPQAADVTADLDFYDDHYNGIIYWNWGLSTRAYDNGSLQVFQGPSPSVATGCGSAQLNAVGGLKVNLDQFNSAYFDHLRQMAIDANSRGMVFVATVANGWVFGGARQSTVIDDWHSANNCNGVHVPSAHKFDAAYAQVQLRWEALVDELLAALQGTVHGLYLNVAMERFTGSLGSQVDNHVLMSGLYDYIRNHPQTQTTPPFVIWRGYTHNSQGNPFQGYLDPAQHPRLIIAPTKWSGPLSPTLSPFHEMPAELPLAADASATPVAADMDAMVPAGTWNTSLAQLFLRGYSLALPIDQIGAGKHISRKELHLLLSILSAAQDAPDVAFDLRDVEVQESCDITRDFGSTSCVAMAEVARDRYFFYLQDEMPLNQQTAEPARCMEVTVRHSGAHAYAWVQLNPHVAIVPEPQRGFPHIIDLNSNEPHSFCAPPLTGPIDGVSHGNWMLYVVGPN